MERAPSRVLLLFMIKRRGACQGLEWAERGVRDGRQIELQFSAPQSLSHATKRRYSGVSSLMNVCSSLAAGPISQPLRRDWLPRPRSPPRPRHRGPLCWDPNTAPALGQIRDPHRGGRPWVQTQLCHSLPCDPRLELQMGEVKGRCSSCPRVAGRRKRGVLGGLGLWPPAPRPGTRGGEVGEAPGIGGSAPSGHQVCLLRGSALCAHARQPTLGSRGSLPQRRLPPPCPCPLRSATGGTQGGPWKHDSQTWGCRPLLVARPSPAKRMDSRDLQVLGSQKHCWASERLLWAAPGLRQGHVLKSPESPGVEQGPGSSPGREAGTGGDKPPQSPWTWSGS